LLKSRDPHLVRKNVLGWSHGQSPKVPIATCQKQILHLPQCLGRVAILEESGVSQVYHIFYVIHSRDSGGNWVNSHLQEAFETPWYGFVWNLGIPYFFSSKGKMMIKIDKGSKVWDPKKVLPRSIQGSTREATAAVRFIMPLSSFVREPKTYAARGHVCWEG
jgi:hypothetical protein